MKYIALLRGVNVGGYNPVKMATLVKAMTSLGFAHVRTYVQSGNVVFTAKHADAETIEKKIKAETFLLTERELRAIAAANPYAKEAKADSTKVFVSFLNQKPTKAGLGKLATLKIGEDRFIAGKKVLYLSYPNGAGKAKLNGTMIERALGLRATARNWRTVSKLLEIVADDADGD